MSGFRNKLPPLDFLLFFEAVARHKNFTKAAQELNVSQAAVSKRIKYLENWIEKPLIIRNGSKFELTNDGYVLASHTSESIEHLSHCLNKIKGANDAPLTLATNTTVSQYWLAPRINDYLLSSNATPVRLTTSDRDRDLLDLENDLVIFYGTDIPTGWDGVELFKEAWVPLISPSLMKDATDYGAFTLLDFDKLTPKWINWPAYLNLIKAKGFENSTQVNLNTYGRSLDAAIKGRGIALGCPDVLHFEIEANRLVALDQFRLNTGRSYFAMWKSGLQSQVVKDMISSLRF